MQLLFVDCCMRDERSRTKTLCQTFLCAYQAAHPEDTIITRDLKTTAIQFYTEELVNTRDRLQKEQAFDHPLFALAQEFAKADKIVIGAPYWDLSFPALLKIYFENIFACGVTFCYRDGNPVGLCRGKKLLYITTAGGFIENSDFGSDYIRGVCAMLQIPSFESIKAEGLDIVALDTEALLQDAANCAAQRASVF